MDERGNNISDQKPLVNIKQALTRLKKEISEMDLRIGVVQHQLMTAKVQSKS
jgi:estrogen-related receptor beta like 1